MIKAKQVCGASSDDRDFKDKGLLKRHAGVVSRDSEDSGPPQRQSVPAQKIDGINSPKNSATVS